VAVAAARGRRHRAADQRAGAREDLVQGAHVGARRVRHPLEVRVRPVLRRTRRRRRLSPAGAAPREVGGGGGGGRGGWGGWGGRGATWVGWRWKTGISENSSLGRGSTIDAAA
jgi:hypothetical protein